MKYNKDDLTTDVTYLLDTINNEVYSEPAETPKSLVADYLENNFKIITKEEFENHSSFKHPQVNEDTPTASVKPLSNVITTPNTKNTTDADFEGFKPYIIKSLNYSSTATVKIGESYYKFTADEEWVLNKNVDVEEIRKELWKKLNEEVDNQIDNLK